MLKNRDDGLRLALKLEHQVGRRADVEDVVERKLLAVELLRDLEEVAVERAFLMRILAVAELLLALEGQAESLAERGRLAFAGICAEPVGDRRVVGGDASEGLAREAPSRREGQRAVVLFHFVGDRGVVGGIDDDRDVGIILRRGAHQGRTADIDILDRFVAGDAGLRYRTLERIEVDDHQIDRLDSVILHLLLMARFGAAAQNSAVDFRMQRLHAAVEHLGKAGELFDRLDLHARRFERGLGASGRDQLDAAARERAREIREPALVGYAEQRAAYDDLVAIHFDLSPSNIIRGRFAARACRPCRAFHRRWFAPAARRR